MAGYSATTLWKKLGYTNGVRAWVTGAPGYYSKILTLPPEVKITWLPRAEPGVKFAHVFTDWAAILQKHLVSLRRTIAPDGVVWIS